MGTGKQYFSMNQSAEDQENEAKALHSSQPFRPPVVQKSGLLNNRAIYTLDAQLRIQMGVVQLEGMEVEEAVAHSKKRH